MSHLEWKMPGIFNNPVMYYGPFAMFNGICHSRSLRKRIQVRNVGISFSAFI